MCLSLFEVYELELVDVKLFVIREIREVIWIFFLNGYDKN